MLNINGKDDISYRYKMIPIASTINGKGNGIYTTVLNLNEVCKYINQPPILILKFLSLNFGSMNNDEKMTITGGYNSDELQKALQIYINRFVICPSCMIPETIPQINKESKKLIKLELKCSSCGLTSEIKCNNKSEIKIYDLIIKYLEKNEWSIASKGIMVNQKNTIEESNEIDPFN
jgi:translation initiation factor 5